MLVAGLMQGMFGFGFAVIATPVTVLATDIKTAIVLNLLPTLTVNAIDVVRGGNWRASLGEYWRVAVYVAIGSFLGAQVLVYAPAEPLRLALAAMIFAISTVRLAALDWSCWRAGVARPSCVRLTAASFRERQSSFPVLLSISCCSTSRTPAQILNLLFGGRPPGGHARLAGEIGMAACSPISRSRWWDRGLVMAPGFSGYSRPTRSTAC